MGIFHILIITFFSFFLLSGCGYKADPYWVDRSDKGGK
jgi:hypothetical protein